MNIHTILNASLAATIIWSSITAVIFTAFMLSKEDSRIERTLCRLFTAAGFNAVFAAIVFFIALVCLHFIS